MMVHCAVVVEVAGKRLHGDKASKEQGVQLLPPCRSGVLPAMRVLGFKREIRLTARDVKQVISTGVAEGRLAVVSRDGMKIMLTKAQTGQLVQISRCLQAQPAAASNGDRGCVAASNSTKLALDKSVAASNSTKVALDKRMVATPSKSRKVAPESSAAASKDCSHDDGCAGPQPNDVAAGGSCRDMAEDFVTMLQDFICDDTLINERKWIGTDVFTRIAATCKRLELFVLTRRRSFRLRASNCVGAPSELIIQRISRHRWLDTLELSGLTSLTPGASVQLADALHSGRAFGEGLRKLSLRGCKALSDTSVRRLLAGNPCLEILDLLEIPRLSNQAFEGVSLRSLKVIAAGSLGRAAVAESVRGAARDNGLGAAFSTMALAAPQPKTRRAPASFGFTSALLSQLAQGRGPREGSAADDAALTHIVLGHCSELQVLPRLSHRLQHLDLRGANLQIPAAAVEGWRPLVACESLVVLCLAGNALLCSEALLGLLQSLPEAVRLRVLDLAATCAEAPFFNALPQQPAARALTHLRLAHCTGLFNAGLSDVMHGLTELEVLDVADCPRIEAPLSDLLPTRSHDPQAVPALQQLRLLGVGQTDFAGPHLEASRRALQACVPDARACSGSLDLFCGYEDIPPMLL
jgi:hypothetical protein